MCADCQRNGGVQWKRTIAAFFVTDEPQGNLSTLLNYAYAKDGEVYLRNTVPCEAEIPYPVPSPDIFLNEFVRELCVQRECLNESVTAEYIPEIMSGCAFDSAQCPAFALWTAATQAAELRARLQMYEAAGITKDDLLKAKGLLALDGAKRSV